MKCTSCPGKDGGLLVIVVVGALFVLLKGRIRYSIICQGTLTRRQLSDLFGLQVKLPPVTTSLITHR